MKKTLALATLISLTTLSHAQPLAQSYSYTEHGIVYSLSITNWNVDKHGIPSFDYAYGQKGGKNGLCNFQKSGHVVADHADDGKNVTLTVYNTQDDATMQDYQIMSYNDDGVTFTSPYDIKKIADYYTFEYLKTPATFNKSCLFGESNLTAYFKTKKN